MFFTECIDICLAQTFNAVLLTIFYRLLKNENFLYSFQLSLQIYEINYRFSYRIRSRLLKLPNTHKITNHINKYDKSYFA